MKDLILVIWKSPQGRNYVIGEIEKSDYYYFRYSGNINDARAEGFELLIPFQNIDATYKSEKLFPIFATRLHDKKRPDIENILRKYNMSEYDELMLLKNGAELPTDNLKFAEKIAEEDVIGAKFYVAGARHYIGCEMRNCNESSLEKFHLKKVVEIVQEKDNEKDKDAILIRLDEKNIIGYVPRYYTKVVNIAIEKNKQLYGVITKINKNSNCDSCIQIEILAKN